MRPRISINLALSADGKISDPKSRPSGWTSHLDHSRLLQLRHGADGLLVGRRTWLADQMTMRVPDSSRQPLRCLVTSHGDLDPLHPLFHTPGGDILVLCTESLPPLPHPENIHFHSGSLDSFLSTLHEAHHVRTLHCEGGGFLVRELLRINAVETIYLTIAGHIVFGGQNSPTLTGIPNPEFMSPATRFTLEAFEPQTSTNECFLTYRRKIQ